MICPILPKLYAIILKNNINIWLERHIKSAKGHRSTMDHIVTFRTITKGFNKKTNILYLFSISFLNLENHFIQFAEVTFGVD